MLRFIIGMVGACIVTYYTIVLVYGLVGLTEVPDDRFIRMIVGLFVGPLLIMLVTLV